jgi:uncharacterized YigZ family protein
MYKTIYMEGTDEFVISRSRFIGWSKPVATEDEALAFVEKIRKAQWDANHNVWAYRLAGDRERYSDDGELKGAAGMPVLEVIRKEGLRDVLVVVTRYFGGVKLGAGGLLRAYTRGAKVALDRGVIIERRFYASIIARVHYSFVERLKRECASGSYFIKDIVYADRVYITILIPPEQKGAFRYLVSEITAGDCLIDEGQSEYLDFREGARYT